ncbi:hypothetical protein CcCBS67573_g03669 [Chytriomyces confervae]|uniref:BRO domain-containing protein 1 n=1 Tax=Chytriomyces confervae TaxID=246404 RepID=A0A507FI65_9FUNG|nr:hypothetical protein CcCBS67573_g03669 [Chytriomyces confervae]
MALQSPILYPPTKKTEEVDFGPPFRAYIAAAYGDDPDKFGAEIALLNRLRDDTRGAGKDVTGRDILYRYYGQLELLDLRFPIDDKHVKVLFTWCDAFTSKSIAQNAVAYEKACVIFNIAATCAAIGGAQNRFEQAGLKLAFNYLQAAAGLFNYINDNFLHPPSVDMSRDSVKALSELMLAQAQECFLEKCLIEKKSGALVAKLAAQAAHAYLTAADSLAVDALKVHISKAWIDICKTKQKYFESLAHYHRSFQVEADAKYGEVVSHMIKSESLAKEAESLGKMFVRNYPAFTVTATAGQTASLAILASLGAATTGNPALALAELTKAHAAVALERKNAAVKDNDVIYHESTPNADTLPAIEKLVAAKPITFAELCTNGAGDVPKIVGPDIFAKLVPLSVHTAASVYSEEQAKLIRGEVNAVEAADEELKVSLESMGIVAALDKLKRVMRGGTSGVQDVMASDESLGLTEEVRSFCDTIRSQEIGRGTGTDELLGVLEGLKSKIRGTLDDIGMMLDKEQHECENMRVKYMNSWTQEPSVKLTAQIRHDVRSHRESFDKALATDQGLLARLNQCRRDVAIMSRPLDEVQSVFAEMIRAVATLTKADVAVGNLIDEDLGSGDGLGKLGEQITVEKLDGMIQRLRTSKTERASTLNEFKTKVREDDISASLLLNKNKESQVFQAELAKFKPYQSRLASNIATHTQLLVDIATEYEKLKQASTTIKVLELRDRRRQEITKDWKASYSVWKEAKDGLNKGVRFYTDLSDLAQSLRNTVVGFVNRRNEESIALMKRLEAEEAMKGQRALKDEMARLSISSQQQAPSPSAQYQPAYQSPTSPHAPPNARPVSFPPAPPASAAQPGLQQYQPQQVYGGAPAPSYGQPQQQQPQNGAPLSQPAYGGAPMHSQPRSMPTAQPIYSGAPQSQPSQPTFGGAPQSQPSQPTYGGAPQGQPSQPTYGGAPQGQPSQPVYGGAPQNQQSQYNAHPQPAPHVSAPTYGGVSQQTQHQQPQHSNPIYGGAPPTQPSNGAPTYGGAPTPPGPRPPVYGGQPTPVAAPVYGGAPAHQQPYGQPYGQQGPPQPRPTGGAPAGQPYFNQPYGHQQPTQPRPFGNAPMSHQQSPGPQAGYGQGGPPIPQKQASYPAAGAVPAQGSAGAYYQQPQPQQPQQFAPAPVHHQPQQQQQQHPGGAYTGYPANGQQYPQHGNFAAPHQQQQQQQQQTGYGQTPLQPGAPYGGQPYGGGPGQAQPYSTGVPNPPQQGYAPQGFGSGQYAGAYAPPQGQQQQQQQHHQPQQPNPVPFGGMVQPPAQGYYGGPPVKRNPLMD